MQSGKGTLHIGTDVDAIVEPFLGAHREPTELTHSIFSTIPGSPVYLGTSPQYRLTQGALGIDVNLWGHSSAQGHFRFEIP